MTQAHAPGTSTARPRGSIGWQWWAALALAGGAAAVGGDFDLEASPGASGTAGGVR
ncbi:hypothetical protein GCM10028802_34250 [Terrabacter terrigena]